MQLLRSAILYTVAAVAIIAAPVAPVSGVIIDSSDGLGNTSAPPDDPGWDHVGDRQGLSAIYVGDGWVLTANHVQAGIVTFQGVTYNPVGNGIRLDNGDGTFADLMLFAIDALPPLPALPIRAVTPPIGQPVVMIGQGRNRGATTTWMGNDGYLWGAGRTMRWGVNHVDGYPSVDPSNTVSFETAFNECTPDPCDEGQGANGDSGGAIFIDNGGVWELAGVMFSIGIVSGQPADTALYDNLTYAADLSFYRDQIVAIVATPEPDKAQGLGWSALALALLGRRRLQSGRRRTSTT